MAPAGDDRLDPRVEAGYRALVERHQPGTPAPARLERQAFYERARRAFAVVMTGDTALYGNLIIAKGNIPR
jgi:L-fucose mutarotase